MISPPDCPAFGNFAANTFLDKFCSKTLFAPDLHGYLNFRKKFAILDARPQRNSLVSRYSHAMGKNSSARKRISCSAVGGNVDASSQQVLIK
jgi:hypothetical protein